MWGFWLTLGLGVLAVWQYQRVNQLTASLKSANTENAQLQAQLTQSQSQIADLQRRLGQASAQSRPAWMPDLPVQVTFRPARFTDGMVASFFNYSSAPVEVAALFQSDATHQQLQRHLVLPPNQTLEIGAAQGWAFLPGQTVTLTNSSYQPLEKAVQ